MITSSIIQELHCPYCGSELEIECQINGDASEMREALLRCNCHVYPIIDGILILRPVSAALIEHVRNGDVELARRRALYELLPEYSRRRRRHFFDALLKFPWSPVANIADRATDWMAGKAVGNRDHSFYQTSTRVFPRDYADYLYHRYANPSFMTAVMLLVTLSEEGFGNRAATRIEMGDGRVPLDSTAPGTQAVAANEARKNFWLLDLACGVGHSSYVIQKLVPEAKVVSADHNFVNLYFARHFLAKDAVHICFEAEAPLPFANRFFDAVFCLDAFHYILSKAALVHELERVVAPQGVWLFPHLHNAQASNPAAGMPLPLEGYQRCFEAISPRFFAETALMQNFFQESALDLGTTPVESELRRANAFCMVGSRQADRRHRYENLGSFFSRNSSALTLNPLYQPVLAGDQVHLEMQWPNAWLAEECAEIKRYLPEHYAVDRSLWERLMSHSNMADYQEAIQSLAQQFMWVHLPPGYVESAGHAL